MGLFFEREWYKSVYITVGQLKDPTHPFDPAATYMNPNGVRCDIWKTELENRRTWTQFPASYHALSRFVNLTDYTYTVAMLSNARNRDERDLTLVIPHRQVKGVTSYQSVVFDKALLDMCDYVSEDAATVLSLEPEQNRRLLAVFREGDTLRCLLEHHAWRSLKPWQERERLRAAVATRRKLCALLPPRE